MSCVAANSDGEGSGVNQSGHSLSRQLVCRGAVDPILTAPVRAGQVMVSSVGGVPIVAFSEPIVNCSGGKLASLIMGGLSIAGLAIDPDN